MALTNTTLATAASLNDTQIKVTATTGFTAGQIIRIDNELMVQTAAASGLYVPVRRGLEGSAQVAHGILANVTTGLGSDFPNPPLGKATLFPADSARASIGVDTTFTAADFQQDVTYVITKGSACAITLGAPSKAQDGLRIGFRSASAFAHTVTYAAGFLGDTTSSDIATFAAKVGAILVLEANAGTWGAISTSSVTIA
jgi:hypothetical protein